MHASMIWLELNGPVQLAPSWNFKSNQKWNVKELEREKKRQIKLQTVLKLAF